MLTFGRTKLRVESSPIKEVQVKLGHFKFCFKIFGLILDTYSYFVGQFNFTPQSSLIPKIITDSESHLM